MLVVVVVVVLVVIVNCPTRVALYNIAAYGDVGHHNEIFPLIFTLIWRLTAMVHMLLVQFPATGNSCLAQHFVSRCVFETRAAHPTPRAVTIQCPDGRTHSAAL